MKRLLVIMTAAGLIDDYQLIVCPVILGGGRTLFEVTSGKPALQLANIRSFKHGQVFLRYTPSPTNAL